MQKCKLIQIANVTAGQSAPQGAQEFSSEGTPFIRAGSLIDLINGKTEDEFELVSEVVAKNHKLKLQPKDTILFAKSGMSCMKGYVYKLKKPCYVVSHLACITPNNSVFPNYLKHYFDYNRPNKLVKDESYPSISLDDIKNLEISLPSLPEQKRIADELDIACSAIAKQKQQLKLYDDLIKSKFNEMFGDPVKNDMGWDVKNIGQISELLIAGGDKPQDISKTKDAEYIFPVYSNGETNEGLLCYSRKFKIDKQAITISARGTIGYCMIRDPKFTPVVRLITIVPIKTINIIFLKNLIDNTKIEKTGASQGQLTIPMVKNIKLYIPPIALQQQFADFVNQVGQNKIVIKQSLNETQTLYKALMQKYFDKGENV